MPSHEPPKSPLSAGAIFLLFTDPRRFFSQPAYLTHTKSLLLLCVLLGIENSSEFTKVISSDTLTAKNALTVLKDTTSWMEAWGIMLTTAIFIGPFSLVSSGIWFIVRGFVAGFNPLKNLKACLGLLLWAKAILLLPILSFRILQTLVYSDPIVAFLDLQPALYKLSIYALEFLSIFALYKGVQTVFRTTTSRVKFFFFYIPSLMWLVGML